MACVKSSINPLTSMLIAPLGGDGHHHLLFLTPPILEIQKPPPSFQLTPSIISLGSTPKDVLRFTTQNSPTRLIKPFLSLKNLRKVIIIGYDTHVALTKHYFWDDVYYLLQRFSWREEPQDRINYVSNHGIHQTPISRKTFKDTMATNNFRTCYKLFKWMGGWKKNKIRQVKVRCWL